MGASLLHGRAGGVPRVGRQDGCGHRAGPDRAGAAALRGADRRCGAGRPRGGQYRNDVCRIRRYCSRFRHLRSQPLYQRPGGCGDRLVAGSAGQFPSRGTASSSAVDGVPGLHRLRLHGSSRLGRGASWHLCADHAIDRRGDCDRHRHPGHHAGAMGSVVHAVLRRRQEASHRGPSPRTGRRHHRCRAHRCDRVLRRRRVCGDTAPRRPAHRRRRRRRGGLAATGGQGGRNPVRDRSHRGLVPGRVDPAAVDRILGL